MASDRAAGEDKEGKSRLGSTARGQAMLRERDRVQSTINSRAPVLVDERCGSASSLT